MLGAFLSGDMGGVAYGPRRRRLSSDEQFKEAEQDRLHKVEMNQDKIKLANGLTKFSYGDEVIWALNRRSADKKARKLGLL